MKKLKQKKRLTSLLLATTMLLGIMNTGVSHAASDENQAELKLATHNVYMLSGFLYPNWGQSKRADLISKSKYIQDNDVVIFNEAFYPRFSKSTVQ